MEAGERPFEAVPFDLSEVLKECSATIEAALERKGLALEMVLDPGAGRYWLGDAERLQQVLLNLIGNSIKFTARGRIDVRVCASVGVGGQTGLRFEVTDTGCGVPATKAAMIFEAFQQVDGSVNRPFEGTGLGLAISRTLVERMSGKIWCDESHGPGAKFVFTAFLPAANEEAVQKAAVPVCGARVVGGVAPGTRVLLVEDNPENVALLQAYLQNIPLSIDLAENGIEALAKRQANDYELVLMDVQMPVMDGYTATRQIRAWEKASGVRGVPIVAVTAHALSGDAGASLEAGCDAHLTKPLERGDLIEAITKFAAVPAPRTPEVLPDLIQARRPAFLTNRWLEVEKMRAAMASQDFAIIQKIGHNCKGIGKGYGFPEISTIGAWIETSAKGRDEQQVLQGIDDLERRLKTAVQEAA